MADRAEREIEKEEFIQKLVDSGVYFIPKDAFTHDLAVAAFMMASPLNVRRQMFHRMDGGSVKSRPACGRDVTTGEHLIDFVREGATAQGRNRKLTRKRKPK